jgi:hypothetical protein
MEDIRIETDHDDPSYQPEGNEHARYRSDGKPMAKHQAISMGNTWIDELILRMKQSNYSNKEIAAEIAKRSNGEINYDPKTVGTRHSRITQLLSKFAEKRLDDELTDWHEGEVLFSNIEAHMRLVHFSDQLRMLIHS